MASIAAKRDKLMAEQQDLSAALGAYEPAVDAALADMERDRIMARIWAHDHTVWAPEPTEISDRLGWLHSPEVMAGNLARLQDFADEVRIEGFTQVLLLGMGGSSLAPEVFSKTFGGRDGYLELAVLDSTDPAAVLASAERLDLARTLFIVSTKSGGTVETASFFKFFYNRVAEAVGEARAGAHFVAITDPGSGLVEMAHRFNFRATFLNDPNIGGRYSALSHFGLVPAALVGIDLATLLNRAQREARNCDGGNSPVDGDNRSARLGAILGELARAGRDKLTFVTSPAVASFGDWVEQLVAESTGKAGTGILPVVGEPVGEPGVYGPDRLFVHLRLDGDATNDAAAEALEAAGHPVVRLRMGDLYDLGGQIVLWEMATAVAGYRLGINPFDQPNVESAKTLTREMVTEYTSTGALPADEPAPLTDSALAAFLAQARPGNPASGAGRSYVALQAYLQPTAETDAALLDLRTWLRDATKMATTVGYGPRFLHSTGQLHKGDAGNGLFIQLTSDSVRDLDIPNEAGDSASSMSFGILELAQALGDKEALRATGRRVIRFHLGQGGANVLTGRLGSSHDA
jgi:glucose-6-phosphate isomerase